MSSERLWGDGGIADQIQAMLNEETAALRAPSAFDVSAGGAAGDDR